MKHEFSFIVIIGSSMTKKSKTQPKSKPISVSEHK